MRLGLALSVATCAGCATTTNSASEGALVTIAAEPSEEVGDIIAVYISVTNLTGDKLMLGPYAIDQSGHQALPMDLNDAVKEAGGRDKLAAALKHLPSTAGAIANEIAVAVPFTPQMEKMSCDSAANPDSDLLICILNHTPLGAFITLSGALVAAAGDNSGLVSGPTDVRLIEGQFNAPLLPTRGIAEVPGPPGSWWHTTTYVDTGEDWLSGGKSKQGYVFFARGMYKAVAVWAADQSINRGQPITLAWR